MAQLAIFSYLGSICDRIGLPCALHRVGSLMDLPKSSETMLQTHLAPFMVFRGDSGPSHVQRHTITQKGSTEIQVEIIPDRRELTHTFQTDRVKIVD